MMAIGNLALKPKIRQLRRSDLRGTLMNYTLYGTREAGFDFNIFDF